jgi:23S rRNA (guanosine2251-2'-O)-methyltransferase
LTGVSGARTQHRIVHGINAVAAVLRRGAERIETVYLQDNLGAKRMSRLTDQLDASGVEVTKCDEGRLEELVGTSKHQGVAAVIREMPPMDEAAARDYVQRLENPLMLVLDSVQDPRNFGACLRTADAAGVDLVVTARNRNVGFTPAVSKVASGAAETQPVAQVGNLARFLDFLKTNGVWVIGADESAPTTVYDVDMNRSVALVLGSEGQGLRRLTRERCDLLVRLPMLGAVESLNVSVAAGICLYECLRQRQPPG